MKNYDIEAYLIGELNPEEQQAFEAELAANPAFAEEVARQRQLTADIEDAVLWERVATARSRRNQWQVWRWMAILALVLGAGGVWWYVQHFSAEKKETPAPPTEQSSPEPVAPPAEADQPAREQERPPAVNQPIAADNPDRTLPPPAHASPQLRGQGMANPGRKALLDAIWYTQYPPAGWQLVGPFRQVDELLRQRDFSKSYARLQLLERKMPTNDTLYFLKGYCLLERGMGDEAQQYFGQIENKSVAGNDLLEWYRALAFLLSGEDDQAEKIFKDMAGRPAHAFKRQAKRALELTE